MGVGGSSGPQATVDPTLLRSPLLAGRRGHLPHNGSVPSSLGGRLPQAAGSPRGRQYVETSTFFRMSLPFRPARPWHPGGLAFRALPGVRVPSLMTHQHRPVTQVGGGQGGGGFSTALHWQTRTWRSAGGSLVPDHCAVPRTRPPAPQEPTFLPGYFAQSWGRLHHDGPSLQLRTGTQAAGQCPEGMAVPGLGLDPVRPLYHPKGQLPPPQGLWAPLGLGITEPWRAGRPADSLESS